SGRRSRKMQESRTKSSHKPLSRENTKSSVKLLEETAPAPTFMKALEIPEAPDIPRIEAVITAVTILISLVGSVYWIVVVSDSNHFKWIKSY
ncbi:hypothetical protein PFISCL1PPCAC_4715, partial [Pristionchus fissidentatus]